MNEDLNSKSSPVISINQKKETKNSKFDILSNTNPLVTSPRVKNHKNNEKIKKEFSNISTVEKIEKIKPKIKKLKENDIILPKIESKIPKKGPQTFFEFDQYFRELKGTKKFEQFLQVKKEENFKFFFFFS